MNTEVIKRVYRAKSAKTKLVVIPANCDIEEGDYVLIKKIYFDGVKL